MFHLIGVILLISLIELFSVIHTQNILYHTPEIAIGYKKNNQSQ